MNVKIGPFHKLACLSKQPNSLRALLVALLVLLVACIDNANNDFFTEQENPDIPFNADIAFSSSRDGKNDIYLLMTQNGKYLRLTEDMGNNTDPLWSPNGDYIAFLSDRDGDMDLYVMNADGSNPRNLSNNSIDVLGTFNWSPDSKQIAFCSRYNSDNDKIYIIIVDDGKLAPVSDDSSLVERNPIWSPDGTRLAFSTFSWEQGHGLSIAELQTGKIIKLLENEPWIYHVDRSFDGNWFTFSTTRGDNIWRVDVLAADGNHRYTSISGDLPASNSIWSSKGDRVAFVGYPVDDDSSQLCIARMNGDELTCLIENGVEDVVTWSPNDKWIIFIGAASHIDRAFGDFDIYAVDVESKEIVNLTPSDGQDLDPTCYWRQE